MSKVLLERRRRERNFGDIFVANLPMNALFIGTAITITRNGTYRPCQREILPFEAAAPAQIQAFCVLFAPEAQENFQFLSSDFSRLYRDTILWCVTFFAMAACSYVGIRANIINVARKTRSASWICRRTDVYFNDPSKQEKALF